jgi:hypothetical protein
MKTGEFLLFSVCGNFFFSIVVVDFLEFEDVKN